MLQDNGFIEYEGGRQTYRTAEKGMKLLEIYEKMQMDYQQTSMQISMWTTAVIQAIQVDCV